MTDSLPPHGQPGSSYKNPIKCTTWFEARAAALARGGPVMAEIKATNETAKVFPSGVIEPSR